jgi:hypothetical protein
MEALVLEEVKNAVNSHAMPFLRSKVRIRAAELGDNAVVMGGAHLIADRLRAKESK